MRILQIQSVCYVFDSENMIFLSHLTIIQPHHIADGVCVCVCSIIIVQGLIIEGLKCAAQKSDSTTEPQITMNMDAAMVNLNINTYL